MESLKNLTGRLLSGLILFSGLASANSIIVANNVDWNRGGSIWMGEDGVDTQAYFAGVIFITLTEDGVQYHRDTLCVDLFTDIFLGQTYASTVLNPADVSGKNLQRVAWLVDNSLRPTEVPSSPAELPPADWVASAAQGAGLQLAIWDIVHDNGDGFAAGRVQAASNPGNPTDSTVLGWAQFYESASVGKQSVHAFIYSNVDMGNGQPAQMLAGPQYLDGGPAPPIFTAFETPEPSTFFLAATAMLMIGKFLQSRRRHLVAIKITR